jgi:tetratricopeptide (TPR) repeat protein
VGASDEATSSTVAADSGETVDVGSSETVEASPASGGEAPPSPQLASSSSGSRPDERVELPPPYVFRRELSRGGMGRILIAWDERHGREVAIKIVRGADAALKARFSREAQVTARLQHPAIVPVYDSGKLADGEPFYVMRLVSGRSLDRVIANRRLPARLALLPNLIAACDAIAYAHDRHVVHRDLKPQNILVGQFGETVVIDWGLAKDLLADPPASTPPPASEALFEEPPTSSTPSGLTLAGQIIGTPIYMPPEQARGMEVDERADVYALGAVLYHVLGGVAPYQTRTVSEILNEVLDGPPPPLSAREPNLPADLCAIVDKAMARDPKARYPSAAELAADLKKFQTGQLVGAHRYSLFDRVRRFTARQRAAVAVAAVLLSVLVVVSAIGVRRIARERDLARARGDEAQAARAAAEGVVQYLIAELADRLQRLGRLDLLKGVGEAVVRYEESTAKRRTDEAPSARQASALRLIAKAEGPRGDRATAERALRASVDIYRRLVAAAPNDRALAAGLLDAESDLVSVIRTSRGAAPEALAFAAREPELTRESLSSNDPVVLTALSNALQTIGQVREVTGELVLEERAVRAAIAAAERAAAIAPSQSEPRRRLALAREALSAALLRAGRHEQANLERTRAVALLEALSVEHAGDTLFQHQLQRALRDNAVVASSLGRYAEAFALAERTLRIGAELARRDPDNDDWQQAHVAALDLRASMEFDTGKYAEARRDYEEVLRIVAGRKRTSDELEAYRSRALAVLGWMELFAKRYDAAIVHLSEAVANEERRVAARPNDREAELALVEALSDLGYAELQGRRYDDAIGHLRRAGNRVTAFLARSPKDHRWRLRACFADAWLGAALGRSGRRDEARAPLEHAVSLATVIVDEIKPEEDSDASAAIAESSSFALEVMGAAAPPQAAALLERILPVLKGQAARRELHESAATELPRWEKILRAHKQRAAR